ncbi:MAG: MFS transporter [Proteobacteria bacterium]|nr:MFS transporter [Pseudomonadota bacterium]
MSAGPQRATAYAWLVFAFGFALLLSDYMARQVLNAVFPLLKAEWHLSDARLGLLAGVVAMAVGVLTVPLSLAADRWGRVRSLGLMALVWSLATLLCAAAHSYGVMLAGRALVGLGEAAYGSVGLALVISLFPASLRASLTAAFMAGGLLGQVLGVALGAEVAAAHGWRAAFAAIGGGGLVVALAFALVVREGRVQRLAGVEPQAGHAVPWRQLVAGGPLRLAYLGSGLGLFAAGALPAWLPSFLNRAYGLPLARSGRIAALLLLVCGVGMVLCGWLADRLARDHPRRTAALAAAYALTAALMLALATHLPTGRAQLAVLALAMALVAGTSGPAGALVARHTPRALHGAAFAMLTLANNVLGLAPGPILTGRLADGLGLSGAFALLPLPGLAAALIFAMVWRIERPAAAPPR